jgi:hypothetical protein
MEGTETRYVGIDIAKRSFVARMESPATVMRRSSGGITDPAT